MSKLKTYRFYVALTKHNVFRATQLYTHRENLRRRFGLVLRNTEHVDSAELVPTESRGSSIAKQSGLERGDYRSSRGNVALGAILEN